MIHPKGLRILYYSAALLLVLAIIGRIVLGFKYLSVFCDAGYYLSAARQMSEGARLYTDIKFGYPPVYLAFLSAVVPFAPHHYALWSALHLILLSATAFLVFKISRHFTGNSRISAFAAWLYAMTSLIAEGEQVLLETPSCLLGMLALWLLLQYQRKPVLVLLSGVAAALAMTIKQFGAGFVLLCLLVILLQAIQTRQWRQQARILGYFAVGFATTFLFVIWTTPECGELYNPFASYGTDDHARYRYKNIGALRFIPGRLKLIALQYMPLILCIFLPSRIPFRRRLPALGIAVCGFVGFMGQYYFSNGWHYLLYIAPFGALLSAVALQNFAGRHRIVQGFLLVAVAVSIFNLTNASFDCGAWHKQRNSCLIERHVGKMLQGLPDDSVLLPYNAELFGQYWITGKNPPMVEGRYCYSFGPLVLTERLMNEKIRHSEYIIKYNRSTHWEYRQHASTERLILSCDTVKSDKNFTLLYNPHCIKP
ncbi:MAG: hypothetical protein J5808_07155 [Paludibacteraceae bacterium]|nr:hypothetical protein [Paludibacteraceae bacterium]